MPRVTLIGAGFGALTALTTLRRCDRDLEIDLIAPKPEFVFYPATIWIPTGQIEPAQVEIPLQPLFQRLRVRFHAARVSAIEADGRSVIADGQRIENDGLIIAAGARYLDTIPGLEHSFGPCGGVAEMQRLGEQLRALDGGRLVFGLAENPDEPGARRAGPLFELLFGIETWLRRCGRCEHFELVLVAESEQPGGKFGPGVVKRLLTRMRARGIGVRLGERTTRVEADRVVTDRGEIGSDLTVFMSGLTGPRWLSETTLPRSPGGLVATDEHCRVTGLDRVYAVGDIASHPGPDWLPRRGHNADLHAAVAARNLHAELGDKPVSRRIRPEMMAVLDMHDRAMLIARKGGLRITLPTFFGFHWLKRAFSWNYVRKYRK
ncbi:MAG: FAD-dependent oxidoreductase [Wenzhouxiangellaceae bacterium]|nr:FAD-dependent oxidoreductase [Wenzhouxiangellaceae bacterium]